MTTLKTMETLKIEQIQNDILELTNKINLLQSNLDEVKTDSSPTETTTYEGLEAYPIKVEVDFKTMMDWADTYFTEKENAWDLACELVQDVDIDSICDVTLSLSDNEIEIEKEWNNTDDIVKSVMNAVHKDFKDWMLSQMQDLTESQLGE